MVPGACEIHVWQNLVGKSSQGSPRGPRPYKNEEKNSNWKWPWPHDVDCVQIRNYPPPLRDDGHAGDRGEEDR